MSVALTLVRKELRAGAGLWLAIVAGILAGELPGHDFRESGILFYLLGALALGAATMGHEYRHGTMTQLLAQPVARGRILAAKLSVLAALLLTVAILADIVVFPRLFRWNAAERDGVRALLVLPLAYGFVVAPWLTLKTRSMLAGMLFSGALAALLLIAGDRVGAARFESARDIDAFKMQVLWTGSALLVIAAAAGLWRSFAALQVPEAIRSDITLPRALRIGRDTAAARRHPLLLLAGKELRLQQLTFVATFIYLLVCAVLWVRRDSMAALENVLGIASVIHAVVVAALAGALSCAEERVMGTVEWQLLQPISGRAQFAVKSAVTIGLTLLLAIGLPVLLRIFGMPIGSSTARLDMAGTILLFLSGSILVSSVSPNAPVAFFACLPAFMAALWFVQSVTWQLAFRTYVVFHPGRGGRFIPAFHRADARVGWAVLAVFVVLLLAMAFENHRDADRSLRHPALRLLALMALFTATCVAFAAAGRFLYF